MAKPVLKLFVISGYPVFKVVTFLEVEYLKKMVRFRDKVSIEH